MCYSCLFGDFPFFFGKSKRSDHHSNDYEKVPLKSKKKVSIKANSFLTRSEFINVEEDAESNGSNHSHKVEMTNANCKPHITEKEKVYGMDTQEWIKRGKEMVDYIAHYLETIEDRRVTPKIEPGYLKPLLPNFAPTKPENWDQIMKDFDKFIMPGITHWQHPRFHAYFPAGNSYPSILADMLSDAIGCIGFSWVC
jgi:aromatic amino acid decarboxylase, putative (fragment)